MRANTEKAARGIETALALFKAGNHAAARRQVVAALDRDPEDVEALLLLARIETSTGHHDKALTLTTGLLKDYPELAPIRNIHIAALIGLRDEAAARQALAAYESDFPMLRQDVSMIRMMVERAFGSARSYRDAAMSVEGSNRAKTEARLALAEECIWQGRFLKGLALAEGVLEIQPEDSGARYLAMFAAFNGLRFADTRRHAREYARVAPDSAERANRFCQLSKFAYFPPFYICHAFQSLIQITGRRAGWTLASLVLFVGGLAIMSCGVAAAVIAGEVALLIPVAMAIYGFYMHHMLTGKTRSEKHSATGMRLRKGY